MSGEYSDLDLYSVLGVSKSASSSDIKKAFHKLAKEYHQDKHTKDGKKFKEISFAYEVLSNPEKKEIYDIEAIKESCSEDIFQNELYSGIFKNLHNPDPFWPTHDMNRKVESTFHTLKVGLEDFYNGKASQLTLDRQIVCSKCDKLEGKPCMSCVGKGFKLGVKIPRSFGLPQAGPVLCAGCLGRGVIIDEKYRCETCHNKRLIKESKTLEFHVDKGMIHGQKIIIPKEGDQEPNMEPGNVIISLHENEHEFFKRKGIHLHCSCSIGITEALCGFALVIKHLDCRDLVVKISPGNVISPGDTYIVTNEGMPTSRNTSKKGNLFIKFDVTFPPNKFLDEFKLQSLEQLMPKKDQAEMPTGEDIEEVNLVEFDPKHHHSGAHKEAYHEDDDGDDERHLGFRKVQCANQ